MICIGWNWNWKWAFEGRGRGELVIYCIMGVVYGILLVRRGGVGDLVMGYELWLTPLSIFFQIFKRTDKIN